MSEYADQDENAKQFIGEMPLSVADEADFLKELEAIATKSNQKFYKGKITSFGAMKGGIYVVFVPTIGGTYGSLWPAWASPIARDAFLSGKNIIVIAGDMPNGDTLTMVSAVDY